MRILTVRQPWAWAIIHGGKDVENRRTNIAGSQKPYRGPVAIHVAEKYAVEGLDIPVLGEAMDAFCEKTSCDGRDHPWFRHVGKIIVVVDLVSVHDLSPEAHGEDEEGPPKNCSPWAEWPGSAAYFHLILRSPRPLREPIPFRGALGLRRLDEDTIARIQEGIAA